jgi:hypothetical protein
VWQSVVRVWRTEGRVGDGVVCGVVACVCGVACGCVFES